MDISNIAPSQLLRSFIEEQLGFGEPVDGPTLSLMFSENPTVLHYCKAEGTVASINAVNEQQWDGMHYTGDGVVLMDVFTSAKHRVAAFIEQTLAKSGFSVSDTLGEKERNILLTIIGLLKTFHTEYLAQVNQYAELKSSMTLRPEPNSMNWDMVLRASLFGENETMFFQFTFPKIIKGMEFLITEQQMADTTQAVRDFFDSFEGPATLFVDLPLVSFAKLMTHQILHKRDITPEHLWGVYYASIQRNVRVIPNAETIKEWVHIGKSEREILSSAMQLAQTYIFTHLSVNAALAQAD